jgi:vacuolar-type H+-ATPase subunit F/Vma7
MQGKVAVLGGTDFVTAFSTLGLDIYPVEADPQVVARTAAEILRQPYALVVVAENVAPMAQAVFDRTIQQALPCVVTVPFLAESSGFATESLGRVLRMATGIDILAKG